ncbi:MAG: ABC transporter ATP-binding protein [Ardenticatenaceae bacterium]|nr:ABC transporter ATP-binding protein [Anaerolineales bacterium]MCB8923549.1 ABC transporter ATP-binding protein [Ardenticatenaceae bacterium]MCB8991880.1 ABC transporter ATP-binding protein [Ardenticatenaceae bacterium]
MKLPIKDYFRLLSQYLRPQGAKVLLLAVVLFGSIGLQLLSPQIVRNFIDAVQTGAAGQALLHTAVLYLLVTFTYQILRLSAAYMTEVVKWQATNWLRTDLSAHCLRLDMAFHNENTPGSMIERIDGDITQLSNFFSQFVLQVFGNALLLIGVLALLYREDWRVGLAFTGFTLLMLLTLGSTVKIGVPRWERQRQAMSDLFGLIEETLGSTEDIRASGAVNWVLDRLQRAIYTLMKTTRKAFYAGNLTWGSANVLFGISMALALGMGIYLLGQGAITIGTAYLFVNYSRAMQRPLEQLARQLQDLQAATAAIGRIETLFAQQPKVQETAVAHSLPSGALSVAFESVTFAYDDGVPVNGNQYSVSSKQYSVDSNQLPENGSRNTDHSLLNTANVLHDINFDMPPGHVLGVLGRTGSGKSTLTKLLFRFHDPQQGAVRLGGHDLRGAKLESVWQNVGMVTQEVQLFQASVRDNLTFFNPTISDERILEALTLLGLDEWFASLADGLDTRLASGGRGLSAGEGQLLAFTRVFLRNPGLVILDEASSRLDPVTEQLIERAIDRLLHGRSAIIVAHRLATVQRADDILILGDGRILEYGPRLNLLANPDSHFNQLLHTGMAEVLA